MVFRTLRNKTKGIIILIVIAFVVTLVYVGGPGIFGRGGEPSYVAKVNKQTISYAEFNDAFLNNLRLYEMIQGSLSGSEAYDVRFQTLQQLINQKLMLQQVKKHRIKVSKVDIDAELQSLKEGFESEAEFQLRLRENNMTERQLRAHIRDNLAIRALQEKMSQVEITEEDIKMAYEQVRASHILFRVQDGDWDAAKSRAETVLAEIKGGKSLAELAKQYSDDTGTKDKGGDLDFFSRDSGFVKEFTEAAFALKVGEVSEPVKTDFGYHIIQVTDRKEAVGPEFEAEKEAIRERLIEEKGAERFEVWFNEVRTAARIEVTDPSLRAQQFVLNNQLPQAVSQYQEAIAREPRNPYLRLALGKVYQQLDDIDSAIKEYEQAVGMGANDPEFHLYLGLAYREKDRDVEAAEQFRRASELDPMDFQLHFVLLQLFTSMGLEEDAKVEENKLIAIQQFMEEQRKAYEKRLEEEAELERKLAEAEAQGK
ncbi:MAG: tetratricopeptide repeat protein [Firmicutes bacterium]|jgi:parvulin-like peptidyl-prolyl isomerase|nr:tetratricopeptide repeat protein [Bacillota bacterium]